MAIEDEPGSGRDFAGAGPLGLVAPHPGSGKNPARRPYPKRIGEDKLLVWGPGGGGRLLQVIFVVDEDGTAFIIHGRELTRRERGLHRRKGR